MPTTVITGLQNLTKNCFAVSEELGLVLISNGEELPYLLTPYGELFTAGIIAPSSAVVAIVEDNGAGNLTSNKWAVYAFAYAIEGPLILIAPAVFSNPSSKVMYQIGEPLTGGFVGDRKVNVSVFLSANPQVTHVYIYRTALAVTSEEAQLLADAGDMYLIGKVLNTGTPVFEDNVLAIEGNALIELANHPAPQFKFCIWDGNYFWGWGNHPLRVQGTWDTDGVVTLNSAGSSLFAGREGQYITFDGVTTGGVDGRGAWLLKVVSAFVGQTIDDDGNDLVIPSAGSGNIVIQGEGATLYRSAYRNPFSWGHLKNVGGIYVPELWFLKVAGSLGTAIAVMPNQDLLKLDMEFPTLSVSYNLSTAGTEQFEFTKQRVSTVYSVTSHFSQFPATSNGRSVLWGMDFKNLAILEFDGVNQTPVSGPISTILRTLSKERYKHLLCHGLQDSNTEINAIWCSTNDLNSSFKIDFCIYYHWPTGFWGVVRDYDVLCSAPIEDLSTSERITMVGTESGFLGRAFDAEALGNWLPASGIYSGLVAEASVTTLTRSAEGGAGDFGVGIDGVIGNYVIVVSSDGLTSQIRSIVDATTEMLTVDHDFDPVPEADDKFFIGLIEVSMLKYFDAGTPSTDKKPFEYWAGLANADPASPPRIQYHPEHSATPTLSIELKQDADLDIWFTKLGFPTKLGKTFGLSLVDRSYRALKFFNFTIR